ncbi:HlyD family type I secretion periplasmic adaptor subunit [Roseibium salinum]|uniref:Membrane fusion protein (MFP) family protein n=1 Tax=Roseibium salinum TaxID=1604349 RepID=A0ABT3QVC6_9HYPH|nr:HlyD family type I secretion periplasmic adaptor subunit [Roseibium sp. DSM 29163]MCX2720876.1 HlyD family type I secretion periplasmic adaptor subunit [Roseibium sp. DSM 29163]
MNDLQEILSTTADRAEDLLRMAVAASRAGFDELVEATRVPLAFAGIEPTDTNAMLAVGAAGLVAVFVLFRLYRLVVRRRAVLPSATLEAMTRYPRRLGIAAVALFVLVFIGWSALAPLASAALAPGIISPDGYRKTVQHLEGGIIRSIHVREGEKVEAGDPLISLDNTRAKALDAEIRERLRHVLATAARLEAERTGAADIVFPDLLHAANSPELQRVMEGQRQLLSNRQAAHKGRIQIFKARVRQLEEQNAGLKDVIAAEDEQLALIDEEITAAQALLDKGLERKPRVLALKRYRADISAQKASNRAKIAENAQAVGETELQLLTITEERQEKIGAELADTRRILAELKSQLPSREDILKRTVIRAPVTGTVMNMRVTTESGVMDPGQPLLDIVPEASGLIIDAKVRPTDIERIRPGMPTRVVLTAYRQRNLPQIHGRLRSISADALIEERTGESYFLAKVEVAPEELADLDEVKLVPGMPAEILLMDSEQTLFSYLVAPILDSARRSFREN